MKHSFLTSCQRNTEFVQNKFATLACFRNLLFVLVAFMASFGLNAQCVPPSISCEADITVYTSGGANTDKLPGDCGAVVRGITPQISQGTCPPFTITYYITGATTASGSSDASGTFFYTGSSKVVYIVTDQAVPANRDTCFFFVTVLDDEDPFIECPDNITVDLEPLECETVVTFDAIASDNCPGVSYEVVTDLESGDLFPIGNNVVVYAATDAVGNTATCSFSVTINDYFNSSLGCINRNVSLDQHCTAIVDPYMILTGFIDEYGDTLLGCIDSFYVNIVDTHGNNLGNTVTGNYVGKTLDYTISNPSHDFYCWGTLKIEDKLRPRVFCTNDTLSCIESLSNARLPILSDNCPGGKLILLSEVPEILNCHPEFLQKITKIWTGEDKSGNRADTCTQIIYIARTDLGGIVFPKHYAGDQALVCGRFARDANGFPLVSVTGVPTLYGQSLYPFTQSAICNGFVTYTDKWTFTSDCKRIMIRTWEVGEWWCNSTNIRTWVQSIEIKDTEAPVIGTMQNIIVSTGPNSCTATLTLPPAPISDNCNTWTVRINTGQGVLYTNGGTTQLTAGNHSVIYTATDFCGNQSSITIRVTVIDRVEPIAICKTRTVISLKEDGTAWLNKASVDAGSFDECGPVDIKIRRMSTTCDQVGTEWSDHILFCCADLGKENMVVLQVTDQVGRVNQCMVTVEVQDKRIPVLTCPSDITVDCSTPYDTTDLGPTFGYPSVTGGGCAGPEDVDENYNIQLNNCRIGTMVRSFTLTHNNQVAGACTQTIQFVPVVPFSASMIQWPKDTTFVNSACTVFDLDPENLPNGYNEPVITEEGVCDLVASSYSDDEYYFTSNGACLKIVRTWTVINWCVRNPDGTIWQSSREQVIVIHNTQAPVITSPVTTREVCSYNADCTPVPIKLIATASDDCTPINELKWRWTITLENGNKIYGNGNDATGLYPFGNHRVDFEVEDKCGNINYTGFSFEVKSCKAPIAYAKLGLSTSLVAMDTNGDGTADTEMSLLTPAFFDNGSYQSCGNTFVLSFSADVEDDTLIVSCDDIGLDTIQLWITDENGNQSFVNTTLLVEDNNNVNICPNIPGLIESDVYGRIHTPDNNGIENVTVRLESAEVNLDNTEDSGKYGFNDKLKGKSYIVNPVKGDDFLNGVSTLDLVMIQRHILGANKINTPWKLIAADVNQDDKISASDLVALRKLILGIVPALPNNKSWRFVWDGHVFADPASPWSADLKENYSIDILSSDMSIDFTGIKLGDIDGNVTANISSSASENRTNEDFSLWFNDRLLKAGETLQVPFYASENVLMQGMQWQLNTDGILVNGLISAGIPEIGSQDYIVGAQGVKASLALRNSQLLEKDQQVFALNITAQRDGRLSEMFAPGSEMTPEIYAGENIQTMPLHIRSEQQKDLTDFEAGQIKPNPWTESAAIAVALPEAGLVNFKVQDAAGKLIASRSIFLSAGQHFIPVNRDVVMHSGVYIYSVEYAGETRQGKMIVID